MPNRANISSLMAWTRLGPMDLLPREALFVDGNGTLCAILNDGSAKTFPVSEASAQLEFLGTADNPLELVRVGDMVELSSVLDESGAIRPRKYFNVKKDADPAGNLETLANPTVKNDEGEEEGGWYVSAVLRRPSPEADLVPLFSRLSPDSEWKVGHAKPE